MVTKTYGSALHGTKARTLTITIRKGKPGSGFSGMPGEKESQGRITASLKSVGVEIPPDRMVSFSPASPLPELSSCALPVALGLMISGGEKFSEPVSDYLIVGALAPDGKLQPVRGALPIAIQARKEGFKGIVLPKDNASEAAIVNDLAVIGIKDLEEAVGFFKKEHLIEPVTQDTRGLFYSRLKKYDHDFSEVPGYRLVKRAMEIGAAGKHDVLMVGPPDTRKSEIAGRLPGILPPISLHESLETTRVYSLAGKLGPAACLISGRPCRRLHHSVSIDALTGSGSLPGEVSLAHNGVLFLNELPEFKSEVPEIIERLLETRRRTLSRDGTSSEFPANFLLVAGMNPCPCGYHDHPDKTCRCSSEMIQRYLNVVAPLTAHIDLQVETAAPDGDSETSSEVIRERVMQARERQSRRLGPGIFNAMMSPSLTRDTCRIAPAGKALLKRAMERSGLSQRAGNSILKVSRTIADLAGSEDIGIEHLAEAIRYRSLDRIKAQLPQ